MKDRPCVVLAVLYLAAILCSSLTKNATGEEARLRRLNHPSTAALEHDGDLELSNSFPSFTETLEMARLAGLVYRFKQSVPSCDATFPNGTRIVPEDLICHTYVHEEKEGTQVLIVSHPVKHYIAVVFAGTDDLRSSLKDGNILMKPFGPLDEHGKSVMLPNNAKVHSGFDNGVFRNNLFINITNTLRELKEAMPSYKLFTTGHSLGAANSVLTAVGLALLTNWKITSISFGCPQTGNHVWRDFVNSELPNLGIWRMVLGLDLVPRLPELGFCHVGHTLQCNTMDAQAYYLHHGNDTLGYAGVPSGWATIPFIILPGALASHTMHRYAAFLNNQSAMDPSTYFFSEFARIPNSTETDDEIPDPPDDDIPATENAVVAMIKRFLAL